MLLVIAMIIFCLIISLGYWLGNSSKNANGWAMDDLTNPDSAALQNRINSKLFDNSMVDMPGSGLDIDSSVDQNAMEARLAGLTKNVTTEKMPSAEQLEIFYQQNKHLYREPAKIWLWLDTYSTARYGGQVFDIARRALDTLSDYSAADGTGSLPGPGSDRFNRYEATLSTELEEKYGRGFTSQLLLLIDSGAALPCWAGPISSAIGAHLVCVEKINRGAYTPFEEIKSQLINDWRFSVATES
jgi:hypothetical protein